MQQLKLEELEGVAKVDARRACLTCEQRLRRWADLLDADPHRLLDTFTETEYEPKRTRHGLRHPNSAISVAARDPVLRNEGLQSDTYGEAKRFFDLYDWELHDIVCSCLLGHQMTAGQAAQRVRRVIPRGPALLARLSRWLRAVL